MENNIDNQPQATKSNRDILLWIGIACLVLAGVVANLYFSYIALAIRVAAWVVLACVIILLGLRSTQGANLLVFAKNARIELYKVVWPTRQETVHMTMIIAALVVVVAFLIWCFDSMFVALIGWMNGV